MTYDALFPGYNPWPWLVLFFVFAAACIALGIAMYFLLDYSEGGPVFIGVGVAIAALMTAAILTAYAGSDFDKGLRLDALEEHGYTRITLDPTKGDTGASDWIASKDGEYREGIFRDLGGNHWEVIDITSTLDNKEE